MNAKTSTSGEVSFESVMVGTQAEIAPRLAAAARRPTDPAVIELMLTLLKRVPWTSDSSKPLWRHVFAAVAASKSARFAQEAEVIRGGFGVRPLMKSYLENQFKKAIKGLPTDGPTAAAPAKKKLAGAAEDEASLLAAVYAKPADDAPRQVYADFLMERGDPRGEFISLQLSGSDPKKEKALLKEHGKKWLGGIAPVVGASFEFRRGFLSKALAKFRHEADAKRYGDLPEWSTVEALEWSGPNPRPPGQAPFIEYVGPTMVSLKSAVGPFGKALLQQKKPLALESLTVRLDPMELVTLLASKQFPKLRTLELGGWTEAAVFRNVKTIGSVRHLIIAVALEKNVKDVAAAALQHGIEQVTIKTWQAPKWSEQRFDQKSGLKVAEEKSGIPELGFVKAIGTRADGAVVIVQEEMIHVVDAGLSKVLEAWPIEAIDRAVITHDGSRVYATSYRQLMAFDAKTGESLFELAERSIEDHYSSLITFSGDEQRLSVMGNVVIDLKTKKPVPQPRGAAKAFFTDPDGTFFVPNKLDQGRWTFQSLASKAPVALEASKADEKFSLSKGVLHLHADDAFISYDATSGQELGRIDGEQYFLAYSNDGALVAVTSEGTISVADSRSLKVKKKLKQKTVAAAFAADGATLLVSVGGKISRLAI